MSVLGFHSAATGLIGSVMRVIDRFANAYRRVFQSRICTTVLLLAQKCAWGGETASRLALLMRIRSAISMKF
jgi:hypothetical protein